MRISQRNETETCSLQSAIEDIKKGEVHNTIMYLLSIKDAYTMLHYTIEGGKLIRK